MIQEATAMPANLALASTWDPPLARRQGEGVGREARAKGFSVLLGGAANVHGPHHTVDGRVWHLQRHPRCWDIKLPAHPGHGKTLVKREGQLQPSWAGVGQGKVRASGHAKEKNNPPKG